MGMIKALVLTMLLLFVLACNDDVVEEAVSEPASTEQAREATPGVAEEKDCMSVGFDRAWDVMEKYKTTLQRNPHFNGIGVGYLGDEYPDENTPIGITVYVSEIVEQDTLPEEQRIPQCLDGVQVEIQLNTATLDVQPS